MWVYLLTCASPVELTEIGSVQGVSVARTVVVAKTPRDSLALSPAKRSPSSEKRAKNGRLWSPSQRAKFQRTMAMKSKEERSSSNTEG